MNLKSVLRPSLLAFSLLAAALVAQASDLQCPAGIAAKKGDQPLLEVAANEHMTLLLCGRKDEGGKTKIHISDFEILSSNAQKKTKLIAREKDHDFRVWDEGGKIFVQEVAWFAGGWTPVFQYEISCAGKVCQSSKRGCAFNKDIAIKHQAQRELKTTDWDTQRKNTPEPTLMDSISDSAMTGSQPAQNFFLQTDPKRHFTKEGEKKYLKTQALLKRLLADKCL